LAVNFNGPVRHHPIRDITWLVLRHLYGNVTAVASDNSSITIRKDLPTLPVVNPETAVATSQSLQILADGANGTISMTSTPRPARRSKISRARPRAWSANTYGLRPLSGKRYARGGAHLG